MPAPRRKRPHPAEGARAVALGLAVGGFGSLALVVAASQATANTLPTTGSTVVADDATPATVTDGAFDATAIPSTQATPSHSRPAHTTSKGS